MNQEFANKNTYFEPLPDLPEEEGFFPRSRDFGLVGLREQVELEPLVPEYLSSPNIEPYSVELSPNSEPRSIRPNNSLIIEEETIYFDKKQSSSEYYPDEFSNIRKIYKQQFRNYENIRTSEIKENIPEKAPLKLLRDIGRFAVDALNNGTNALAKEREKIAHKFRSAKMRLGGLGSITRKLQDQPDLKRGVSAVVRRAKLLLEGTQADGEMHRAYTPLIAGLLSESETKGQFMEELDAAALEQSDNLKLEAAKEGELRTDVLIIGAGVHSAIFASELRSQRPNARIVAVDANQRLGGQFRSYGDRPVFAINSRNNRAQDNDILGLPGTDGNLNSFGKKATLQLPDFSGETYPNNVDMGITAAVNQYLSADTMSNVEFVSIEERADDTLVIMRDKESGELYRVAAKFVINSSGAGERQARPESEGVYLAEDIFKHFGDERNLFPMDLFTGKNIVIKGGGDTGRVIAELLTGLGPKEAYGKSSTQFGGPKSIRWFGTDFRDRGEFCASNRPRYQRLASFIPKNSRRVNDGEIACFDERIRLQPSRDGKISVTGDRTGRQFDDIDIVIDATNLTTSLMNEIEFQLGRSAQEVRGVVQGIRTPVVAGRQIGNRVFCVGPAAKLPLSQDEKRTFADGITENTVAIWANQTRTVNMASQIVLRLDALDPAFTLK